MTRSGKYDGVLLQRPEGFWWEAISNSLEHPHIRISIPLAPVPLIRVSLITPPCPPAHPAQDGNSTLNTGQQQSAQGHPTAPHPIPPNKKNQKFPFPEPSGNPCALCVCVPAFSKMSVALFLLVLRPSRTLGCWLGSSRALPVHPELAPVFHQPLRATHVIRLSGATSERGK